jgi:hypothetical protein
MRAFPEVNADNASGNFAAQFHFFARPQGAIGFNDIVEFTGAMTIASATTGF